MKIVFCGTPEFAVPGLRAVLAARHEVPLVLTQPDRPAGRGMEMQQSPVKRLAVEQGIPVAQPEKLKTNTELRDLLEGIDPDVIVVVAYGRIIPKWMLELPRFGNLNVHASLLPKYRGAAPIQWAVANGEHETGVAIMQLEEGLDTGPVFLEKRLPIAPDAMATDLFGTLADVGAKALLDVLIRLDAGTATAVVQQHDFATLAPILKREDGVLDLTTRTAQQAYDRWRGFYPWPGAHASLRGKRFLVHRMHVMDGDILPVNELALVKDELVVGAAGDTALVLDEVQLEGKPRMPGAQFARDFQLKPEKHLPKPVAAPPTREAHVSPARWAAFQVLERVGSSDAHSDDLLHGPMLAGLSPADTGLANALVMGVLRMQLVLETRLLPLLTRPDVELPSAVATVLRLGALQLLFMDRIPPHAALNESVEMVRKAGQPQAAGMVNAVLRKIAAADKTPKRRPIGESVEAMAARLGHPEWLAARWVAAYGRKNAESVCAYDLREPEAGTLFAGDGPAVDDGSRLVAELAAAAAPSAARVWDACAAPGGKTMVLVTRLPQAEFVATDISPKRLARLASRLDREAPGRVRTLQGDAAKPMEELGSFDLILCDAPCTGTGTLARNPEIKVRLAPNELDRQPVRQRAILTAALQRLAPGGTLVYSTCSLEAEENDSVVADVLRAQQGITLSPIEPVLDGLIASGILQTTAETARGWVRGGFLRTLPGANFAGDGFFAAIFQRGA